MSTYDFDPETQVADLSGKVIIITGGTAGLGAKTAEVLARHGPEHIIITSRNMKAADELIASLKQDEHISSKVKLDFVSCDLASLESVNVAAKQIEALVDRIDVLANNAGIMALPPGLTKDGYEIQFGTNHLGHALLTKLLLPLLLKTAETSSTRPRVVFNTSLGHAFAPPIAGINFDTLRTPQPIYWPILSFFGPWVRYGQSKLANILYASELAKRYPQLHSTAVHPGVIFTGLVSTLGWLNYLFVAITSQTMKVTIDEGVKNQIWAATAPESEVKSGEYYVPVGKVGDHNSKTKSDKLAKQLWDWTEEQLAGY